ncbi:MAG: sigma-70 family RNA polymerase sigma factor [Bacillota bacterium]|nr:sigma-70 family RNA polymerase sigma factor [Bacillota bacterium]
MHRQLRPHGPDDGAASATGANRADLRSALAGDKNAFARLIARRERNLYGLALVILGCPEDAGDALQNGVVLAYRKLGALRHFGSFDSWLRRIVAREALAIARRRAAGPLTVASRADMAGAHQPTAGAELSESAATRLDLAAALASLDDGHRTAVVLRFVADMPVREIARLTGVPGGTVKSRIHYGLKRLRQLMAPTRGQQKDGGNGEAYPG